MIEVHPFGKFVPPNATCLVLGTFPTHKKNWRFNSFYPGRSNFFWRMLSDIYKHKFHHISGDAAGKERLGLCAEKGIALTDMIYICRRKSGTSSKDSDLEVIEKMDIVKLLKQNPGIETVILASSSGPVSAHKLFFEHLAEKKVPYMIAESKPPIHGNFVLNKQTIQTHTLYSTSGINIGRYAATLQQFKDWLP